LTAEIIYTPAYSTSGDVIAAVSFNKTGVTVTGANFVPFQISNMGMNVDYLFTGNGYYQFTFADGAGNTGVATAFVDRIDTLPPVITNLTYTPSSATNQDVLVTLTTDEPIQTPL
jgi:hypothetical protein